MVTDGRLDMFMGDMWKPSIRERLVAKREFTNSLDNMHASVEIIVSCKSDRWSSWGEHSTSP